MGSVKVLAIYWFIISILIGFKFGVSVALRNKSPVAACSEDVILTLQKTTGLFKKSLENIWKVPARWMSTNETTGFALTVFEPHCRSNYVRHLELTLGDEDESQGSQYRYFYPNSYFQYESHIYAPDEYCVESAEFESPTLQNAELARIKIKFCKPDCAAGKKRACIKKCCPLYKIFSGQRGQFCVDLPPGSVQFSPQFYNDFYTEVEKNDLEDEEGDDVGITRDPFSPPFSSDRPLPHFKFQHPKVFKSHCKDHIVIPSPTSEISADLLSQRFDMEIQGSPPFRVRKDGVIMYKKLENRCGTLHYRKDYYCVDGVRGALSPDLESPFNNTEEEYISFQCQVPEKNAEGDKYLSLTFGALLLITSVFPLITTIVYILLWKRQNVHGWAIAATSGSLYFMYVFQGMSHIIGVTLHEAALNTFYCQLIAVLTHFFMMATFTWCTVMSCDLWLTFRSVVPMNQRLQAVPRYLKYSAFGWGIPTIIVAIGILMDFVLYNSTDCSYHAVPAYGQQNCWIVESSLGEYLYYPGLLLICINIGLFTATCVKLCMYGQGPAARSRRNDAFGECFSRFSKLFCVMGISWIFEILSWYISGLGYVWYWNIFDVFNIFRAVFVFVIYVCKKDIIHQLEDAYPGFKRIARPFSRLILRKCSDQLNSTESTTVSAAAPATTAPSSPGISLKAVNCSKGNNKRAMGNRSDIPK